MRGRGGSITILVGATDATEELRRRLTRTGAPHAGAAQHLRGLRRAIRLGWEDLVVLCVALDRATIERYGDSLARLLSDRVAMPGRVHAIGVLTEELTAEEAQIGCDVYVRSARGAEEMLAAYRTRIVTPAHRLFFDDGTDDGPELAGELRRWVCDVDRDANRAGRDDDGREPWGGRFDVEDDDDGPRGRRR